MAKLQASPEAIRDAVQKVNNTKGQIDSQLVRIRATVQAVAGVWQGAAAGQFQNVMQAWDKEARDLSTALDRIAQNMSGNETVYTGTEEQVQGDFKGILGKLGASTGGGV